jgi:hypothetical protein
MKYNPKQKYAWGIRVKSDNDTLNITVDMAERLEDDKQAEPVTILEKTIDTSDLADFVRQHKEVNCKVADAGYPICGAVIELVARHNVIDNERAAVSIWLCLSGALDGVKAEHDDMTDKLADTVVADFVVKPVFEEAREHRHFKRMASIMAPLMKTGGEG